MFVRKWMGWWACFPAAGGDLCRTDPDVAAADEQQRQQEAQQQHRHLVGVFGGSGPLFPTKGAVRSARVVGENLVLRHWHGAQQRQGPDDAQPEQRILTASNRRPRTHHRDVAVHGHGGEREDADQHADGGEKVRELTEESSEHPLWQRVDGGMERDAEEEEEEVRGAQVQDEEVGGAPGFSSPSVSTPAPISHLPDHHHH